MLNKRPHILTYLKDTSSTEPYQDNNGDWVIPDNEPVVVEILCRAEPNGQGKFIASEDGQNIVYSWVVYLDLGIERIPYGTEVKIFKDGDQFASGQVKLFVEGQKNCRLWL